MPTVEQTLEVAAPVETVWGILADPSLIPKLIPDVISNKVEPAGPVVVGQKGHAVGKISVRRTEFFTEVTEVVPSKKIVISQRPGGLFKTFNSTVTLEPTKKGTRATQRFQYEPSLGYLGKALGVLLVTRTINRNAKAYLQNLKELCELKEMPKTST